MNRHIANLARVSCELCNCTVIDFDVVRGATLCVWCLSERRGYLNQVCLERDHRGFGGLSCEEQDCVVRRVLAS